MTGVNLLGLFVRSCFNKVLLCCKVQLHRTGEIFFLSRMGNGTFWRWFCLKKAKKKCTFILLLQFDRVGVKKRMMSIEGLYVKKILSKYSLNNLAMFDPSFSVGSFYVHIYFSWEQNIVKTHWNLSHLSIN